MNIPPSVHKMIESAAKKRVLQVLHEYEGIEADFKAGAEFGYVAGIEAICEWLTHKGQFAVRNHCPANLKRAIESHFKDQLRETE